MKPHRVRLTHELVTVYGIYKKLNIYRPVGLPASQMQKFHTKNYINFLQQVNCSNKDTYELECDKYLGKPDDSDCPIFDGIFRFNQRAAGASVGAAQHINASNAEIAINWGGGFHHAKKAEASGFCYINDIVLAILELLKKFTRVLYVDIDVHHGDGVEEAFYSSNRVLTLSFHKGGNFFPGTGSLEDVGDSEGKYYAVNFPLHEGMDDDTFTEIFRATFDRTVSAFQPGVIVLQCGADSLTRDRLGCFDLTLMGHGACVAHVRNAGLPVLVVGGGGYTVKNVARCWAYETSVVAQWDLPDAIPFNDYYYKFGPDFRLHIAPSEMENYNTKAYIEATRQTVFESLKQIEGAPSVSIGSKAGSTSSSKLGILSSKAEAEGEFLDEE